MRFRNEGFLVLLGDFLRVELPVTRGLAPGTVKSYKKAIDLLLRYLKERLGIGLGDVKIDLFNRDNVQGFLAWLGDERGCSGRTKRQRMSGLRAFVEYAVKMDVANAALLAGLMKIKLKKEPRKPVGSMTEKAFAALLEQPAPPKATEYRNWVMMVLMYETACRCQEACDLRVGDVVLGGEDGAYVYVKGKGSKERILPIRPRCAAVVSEYVARAHPEGDKDAPLFYVRRSGGKARLSTDAVESFLKRYGEAARKVCGEVPERVHPHLIRHTRAQHLYDNGMSLKELALFLGHDSTKTTLVYAESSVKTKRRALEKASGENMDVSEPGSWEDDEAAMRRLAGLA